MAKVSRREWLQSSIAAAASLAVGSQLLAAANPATKPQIDKYVTNFYQFFDSALKTLSGPNGLPNGPQYLHIFAQSAPSTEPRSKVQKLIHSCGSSFKYAYAFDCDKCKGWQQADDDQLKRWAIEFREVALATGPADYFAFNEMPTTGAAKPILRGRVTRWMRMLHEAGGGPKLRGIFYFTEQNTEP